MRQKYMQELELSHIVEENREYGGEHGMRIRFTLKSQFNVAENRMGFLFPLSCLLLLAFPSAQTARLVTRASKLINTQRPVQAQADKPGSQTSSPLVTPGPQPRSPSRHPHRPRFLHCLPPPRTPQGRCPGPGWGERGAAVAPTGRWASYLAGGRSPRRKPPGRSPRGAHVPVPPRPNPRATRRPGPCAFTVRRSGCTLAAGGEAARGHRRGSREQAGPPECRRPARLPLNLGTAAGHSPHPAPPPPQRTPPNSPPPTRAPQAPPRPQDLGSILSEPLTLDPRPPAPPRAASAALLGTVPGSEGHCLVS
ncbi:basic proline-rich protein-like [Herpailurus yagouaroundi]|uniref:basic proline-rich protein-like n=1 Tax=Herpailurus yagouaroundi TaxID=1608482 RepID=UPI001AD697C6|nr:basic proline-rich protein-like [Puma yagouaroundi]